MSRQIDLTKPLTDEDRQYLVDRADTVSLERNAALVAGSNFVAGQETTQPAMILERGTGAPPDGGPGSAEPKLIEDMTVEELKDALRPLGLPVTGNKDELLARLVEARTSGATPQ